MRDYVVSVMDHPTGPERGAQDQEVVDALARRVLVHRPQMEVRQAYALAYLVFCSHCAQVLAVLMYRMDADEARAQLGAVITELLQDPRHDGQGPS